MSREAGHVTPESDDAPTGGDGRGAKDQGTADGGNATTAPPFNQEHAAAERNRVAARDALIGECRRRAQLKGIGLHVFGNELFFHWAGLSKSLQSPEAAATWLDHIGAPR